MKINRNILIGIAIVLTFSLIFLINEFALKNENDRDLLSGKHYVLMTVKDYGNITLELDADTAPITVTNFIDLVKDEFYNGLTFHRIISGFMIQGGKGNENSTNVKTIKGEFSANGIENNILHERGVISMARNNISKDSASTEFFIVQETVPHLDGQYAAFGKVVSGMDVVDEIAKVETIDDNGTVEEHNQPQIEKIEVIDSIELGE